MRVRAIGILGVWIMAWLAGCGAATRATVHEEDMKKVFPWPDRQKTVVIRVRPQTTLNNMCVWFGSYQEVEVDASTTFYMVDELGKPIAYTPTQSTLRRLASVKKMEIRWPLAGRDVAPTPTAASPAPAAEGAGVGGQD